VIDAGQEGSRLLKAHGDLWEACTVLAFMELAALELGQIQLADEIAEEVETLAPRLGHAFVLEIIHGIYLWNRHIRGAALDLCEADARRHLEVAGPLGFRHFSATMLAEGAFIRGEWDEALQWAEDATRHSPENHHNSGPDWACLLRVLAYSGKSREVHALLEQRRPVLPVPGRRNGYGPWCMPPAAVEALWVIGDREGAAGFYPLVRELIESTGVMLDIIAFRLLERIAGMGAAAGGHWDLAEQCFETALRQAEEISCVIEAAETRRFYAEMLLERNARGDRDLANSLVDEALLVYRRIGMPRHEELARALAAT
jgi:tetratricopeptide (TPR) repeat protein